MDFHVVGPLSALDGLEQLAPLYRELHATHVAVARYGPLVADATSSWTRRRALYAHALLHEGAAYFLARTPEHGPIGYAFVVPTPGPDDTFATDGVLELVTLVVARTWRGVGVGRRLVAEVEAHARAIGVESVKVAVMAGNDRARDLYLRLGYRHGETLLYRKLDAAGPTAAG